MSAHDRGAFGQLLAEAKELMAKSPSMSEQIHWCVNLNDEETPFRWCCQTHERIGKTDARIIAGNGRTGEEALRRLVEKLRAGHTVGDGSDPK